MQLELSLLSRNPFLQLQTYEPKVFLHSCSQELSSSHSSLSVVRANSCICRRRVVYIQLTKLDISVYHNYNLPTQLLLSSANCEPSRQVQLKVPSGLLSQEWAQPATTHGSKNLELIHS